MTPTWLKANAVEYYQHVLLCTDVILDIVEEPERFLRKEFGNRFTLKDKSIGYWNNILETRHHK